MSTLSNSSSASDPSACRVLCVGDMGADLLARPVARLPGPGEVGVTEEIGFFPGGNALNIAVALRRLGEPVRVAGCVGDDALGDLLVAELSKLGLDLRGVRREAGAATPSTMIYRAEGEDRRFLHARGAGDRFTGEGVSAALMPEGGVLVVGGYLKLRSWREEALRRMLREARARGCSTVLNVCIPEHGELEVGRCLRLLPEVDVFVPNEDEARRLTGADEPGVQARALRAAGARRVIVTRGAAGLYADDGQQTVQMGGYRVPLVDPSGCGDCFVAGLVAGWLRQRDWRDVLRLASAAGAISATRLGCTTAIPGFEEVERFVREHTLED